MPLLFELRPVGSVMGLQAAPLHSPFKPLAPASESGDRVHCLISPAIALGLFCVSFGAQRWGSLLCHPVVYRVAKPLMPLLFELRPVGSVMGLQAAPLHSPFKPLAPASEPGDRVHKMGLVVFFIIFYFLLLQSFCL